MAGKRKGNDNDDGGSGKKAKKDLIDEGNSVSGCCNEFGLDVHKFSPLLVLSLLYYISRLSRATKQYSFIISF